MLLNCLNVKNKKEMRDLDTNKQILRVASRNRDGSKTKELLIAIKGYKGQNSTETRCRGFLFLESRCRGFLSSEKMRWDNDVVA